MSVFIVDYEQYLFNDMLPVFLLNQTFSNSSEKLMKRRERYTCRDSYCVLFYWNNLLVIDDRYGCPGGASPPPNFLCVKCVDNVMLLSYQHILK